MDFPPPACVLFRALTTHVALIPILLCSTTGFTQRPDVSQSFHIFVLLNSTAQYALLSRPLHGFKSLIDVEMDYIDGTVGYSLLPRLSTTRE